MKIIKQSSPEFVSIDGIDYAVLPLEFCETGYYYTQLFRNGDICLYEVRNMEVGNIHSYELIRVKRSKGGTGTISGKVVEFKAKENYPSDETFGLYGSAYSANRKEKAIEAFQNSTEFFKSKSDKL